MQSPEGLEDSPFNAIKLIQFSGSSKFSNIGADYPIPMVLLLFICLFGITTCSKGASYTIKSNKFVELPTN